MRFGIGQYANQFRLLSQIYGVRRALRTSYKVVKTQLRGLPNDISIEAAGGCNLKCPMCIQAVPERTKARIATGLLSFDDFKSVVDDVADFAIQISLFYRGEPTINKDLPRMIRYATDRGLLTYINTNGLMLRHAWMRRELIDAGLHRMHVSVDGANPETYETYRVGGNLHDVVSYVRAFMNDRGSRKIPIVALQTIATKRTLPEFDSYVEMAKTTGVDKAFAASMHLDQYKRDPTPPELEDAIVGHEFSRYASVENGRAVKKDLGHTTCPWNQSLYIDSDGTAIHCCYDQAAETSFGNVFQTGVKNLWFRPDYVRWRDDVAKPMTMTMCESCTATSASWHDLWVKD